MSLPNINPSHPLFTLVAHSNNEIGKAITLFFLPMNSLHMPRRCTSAINLPIQNFSFFHWNLMKNAWNAITDFTFYLIKMEKKVF